MSKLWKESLANADRPRRLIAWLVLLAALSAIYPSDLTSYTNDRPPGVLVRAVNDYGRYFENFMQVLLPIVFRDPQGVVQLVAIAVATTVATQGTKRLFNDWWIDGTRLGQRPSGERSRHNMPSGHSSMASCAVYFVCRRYGMRYAWSMVPILLLTMYARVALNAHTISAVLCGTLIGFLVAAYFTSRYRGRASGDSSALRMA